MHAFDSDIDECVSSDGGGCEQNCINLQGSYECSCQQGYALESNGISCDGNYCTTMSYVSSSSSNLHSL